MTTVRTCRVCKCTENRACWPLCDWEPSEKDLCDGCATAIRTLQGWADNALKPSFARILREVMLPIRGNPATKRGKAATR